MGFTELRRWLRHQHPMVLLDRVLDHEPGQFIEARVSVSGNLDVIAGHFPERGIYPGTHMIQAFAQTCILLHAVSSAPMAEDELTLITSAKSRFFEPVVPGDQITFRTDVHRALGKATFFRGKASVEDVRIAAFDGGLVRVHESELGPPPW